MDPWLHLPTGFAIAAISCHAFVCEESLEMKMLKCLSPCLLINA